MDFLKEAENKFHKVIDQTADAATDKIGSVIGVEKDKMKDEGIAGVLNEVKKAVPDAESAVSRFISFWKKLFR
ncbi:hypothetical protein JZ751_008003 [Albula glossodonta]|uniref:Uncharacterized protein n=1 Tax=Albula glossodonta TaxID=121402 RepID=A0A8T2P357_9TELE|nr:hypothetical protein JZ751_008003 [Albula glossodonta]